MIKKLFSFFTAVIVTSFIFMSSVSVSGDGSYKTWLQSDSRWGSKTLGGSGDTMAEIGCAVTALAIQVVHSGSKSESGFNPGTLVDYLNKNGGLDSEGNLYWGAVTGMVSSFTFEKRAYFSAQNKSTIIKELTSYINSGYYIIMSVKYDGHWVAIDTIKNGVVYMMDPAQNKNNNLFDYYSVGGMLQVRLYKGKNAPAKVGSTPSYTTGQYKTTDNLNLRQSYSTSSNILLTIPSGKTVNVTSIYNNEWGKTVYNGKTGWIYLEYTSYVGALPTTTTKKPITTSKPTTTTKPPSFQPGYFKCNDADGVNLRSGPGTNNSIICVVPYNNIIFISSVSNNWGKATYNSKSGYVCMDYFDYVSPPAVTTVATTKITTTTTTAKPKITTSTVKTTVNPKTTESPKTTVSIKTTVSPKTTVSSKTTVNTKTTTITNPGTTSIIKGDINKDGKIDNKDVLALNIYINNPFKLTTIDIYIYDINKDKVVNEIDVIYLMKKIRG